MKIREQIERLRYARPTAFVEAADTMEAMLEVVEAADDYVKAVAGDFVASPTECARTFKNRLAKLEEQT